MPPFLVNHNLNPLDLGFAIGQIAIITLVPTCFIGIYGIEYNDGLEHYAINL